MKLKSGYIIKLKEDLYTVYGPNNTELKNFHLSKFGAFLFECTQKENLTNNQLLDKILSSFDISTVLALGEIDTFIKKCKENGIVE